MKKNLAYIISVIVLFGIFTVVYVANMIMIRNLTKKIDDGLLQYQILLNENKELRTRYESLIAKDRIVSIATNQLGMVFPQESPIILQISKQRIQSLEGN
ncbi:MAG: cell division protein FtsL [Ignavibacteria bacterium]|nr:cell division protein FtsL [Ignavibacteria bacterium]